MGIFKKISNLFKLPNNRNARDYWVAVKCNRCGEVIRARVDLTHDLSIEYGDAPPQVQYYCRKELIGEKYCLQQMEVKLTFNTSHQLINRQISGGEFVDVCGIK